MIATILSKGQGLGNQLFCYVTLRAIAKKRNLDFSVIGGETLANNMHSDCGLYFMDLDLGIPSKEEDYEATYYEKDVRLFTGKSIHDMNHGCYVTDTDEGLINVADGSIILGNMQSEDYYLEFKDEIKEWLKVKPEYDCYDFYKDHLCIIHLRCSDYIDSPELFLRKKYWIKGMKAMKTVDPLMEFMIITNDVKEASKILPGIPAYNFDLAKDYSIIKNAKYLLLANSSFTYFPALCSDNCEYILAPMYWARHNVSNGYWASEQNIYSGWHYMDRRGKVYDAEECKRKLNEYKNNSREYKHLNEPPTGIKKTVWTIESKILYKKARIIRLWRGFMRKIRIKLNINN